MLDGIKQLITLKSVDRLIEENNYDLALEKLNLLIQSGYRPAETYLKRGQLCHKLLMNEDAYSDFTYVITHCEPSQKAHEERMNLNLEISNYYEAIVDAEQVLLDNPNNLNAQSVKFLSLVYLMQGEEAKNYACEISGENKYKAIQFMLNMTALLITKDEFGNALKILEVIDILDRDNPIKLLKEANIYGLAGNKEKKNEILAKINSVFPKYFISHFKFSDIYEDRDFMEICFLLELRVFDPQNLFAYPMAILEGYRNNMEGHIIDSKECFERAIEINPNKAEAYVLLGETLQLMSGYDNPEYKKEAEKNYKIALSIYEHENIVTKIDAMKRQIKHLNSAIVLG